MPTGWYGSEMHWLKTWAATPLPSRRLTLRSASCLWEEGFFEGIVEEKTLKRVSGKECDKRIECVRVQCCLRCCTCPSQSRAHKLGRQARAEGGRYPVSGAQHGQPEHDFVLQSEFSTRDDGGGAIVERRRKDVSV